MDVSIHTGGATHTCVHLGLETLCASSEISKALFFLWWRMMIVFKKKKMVQIVAARIISILHLQQRSEGGILLH